MCDNDSRNELWRYFPSESQGMFPQLIHWSENQYVRVQINPAIRHQDLQLSDVTLVVNVSQHLVKHCLRRVSVVYSNGGKNNFLEKQECIPVGCVPAAAVAVCWGGEAVCSQRGGIPACTEANAPPCGQTDRCKNITFATLLRTVKMLAWRTKLLRTAVNN